jgi:hypothetical protein
MDFGAWEGQRRDEITATQGSRYDDTAHSRTDG